APGRVRARQPRLPELHRRLILPSQAHRGGDIRSSSTRLRASVSTASAGGETSLQPAGTSVCATRSWYVGMLDSEPEKVSIDRPHYSHEQQPPHAKVFPAAVNCLLLLRQQRIARRPDDTFRLLLGRRIGCQ